MSVAPRSPPHIASHVSLPADSNAHAPRASLLGLPTEIRLRIYSYLLRSVHNLDRQYLAVGPVYDNGFGYESLNRVSPSDVQTLTSIYKVSSRIRQEVLPFGESKLSSLRFSIQDSSSAATFLCCPSVMQGVRTVLLDLGRDFKHFKGILNMAALCPKMSCVTLRHGDLGHAHEKVETYECVSLEETLGEGTSYVEYFQQKMGLPRPFRIKLQIRIDHNTQFGRTYFCDFPAGGREPFGCEVEEDWQFDYYGGCG